MDSRTVWIMADHTPPVSDSPMGYLFIIYDLLNGFMAGKAEFHFRKLKQHCFR
jgi:hypothetical protein